MSTDENTSPQTNNKLMGAGLLSAIAASLCCITPILALISGASGIAAAFSWMDPFRPYLIGISIVVLAFAWYQKLKPKSEEELDCACETNHPAGKKTYKANFWQSKKFLGIITIFAIVMLTFPLYADAFYPSNDSEEVTGVEKDNLKSTTFEIKGMTCSGCESHVENDVHKLKGIVKVNASYDQSNAIVKYDDTKVSAEEIKTAINGTGYQVVSQQ